MGGNLKISYYYAEMLRVCSKVYKIPVCFPETVEVCRDGSFKSLLVPGRLCLI